MSRVTIASRAALILSSLAIALAGCDNSGGSGGGGSGGSTPDDAAPAGAATKSYVIGVIAKSQSNPVFQAARSGAFAAGQDLEKEHGIDIEVIWRTPNNEDAQQQAQYVEQLVSQGVDGIAISASDANLLRTPINDAVDRGIEVVCFDSDVPDSKRFAYYGIDDVEAGKAVMEELAKAMGYAGTVAVLGGNQNAPNLQARIRGVQAGIAEHDGITLKDVYYHPETAPDAAAKVQQVQTANPDITGWAMVGGWPLFTENALDGVYENAKVVAVDHLPEELEYVKNGQVQALIGQDCFGWGYESVRLLIDKLHLEQSPDQVINNFDLQIVTPENVSEYEGQWEEWLGN